MAVDTNKVPGVRLTPVQELKLTKPDLNLYVGQILKTVVVATLSNDQVLININGQNLNAKTSQHFTPGELLDVKVIAHQEETVLEVQTQRASANILQNALIEYLPKQAPATNLLNNLAQLAVSNQLPISVNQHINALLANITPLSQLPSQLAQAISQSGVFFESFLTDGQRQQMQKFLRSDFKGLFFKLLASLGENNAKPIEMKAPPLKENFLYHEALPLPGAVPQPLQSDSTSSILELSTGSIQSILHEQTKQALARATSNQINHLQQDGQEGFLIMCDIPIKTQNRIDVIPLQIRQHKSEPMQMSKWSIAFALNLPELGKLQASVAVYAHDIDIKINAENPSTLKLMNEHKDAIGQALFESGLHLRNWSTKLGLEENKIDTSKLKLLDIRI